jgi:hypothetical protein
LKTASRSVGCSSILAVFQTANDIGVFLTQFFEFPEFQQRWGGANGFYRSLDVLHSIHDLAKAGKQFDVIIRAAAQDSLPRFQSGLQWPCK